jgi:hypothetical protein
VIEDLFGVRTFSRNWFIAVKISIANHGNNKEVSGAGIRVRAMN